MEQRKVDLVWDLLEASLSHDGYKKVEDATRINQFLGTLASRPAILNERSYL